MRDLLRSQLGYDILSQVLVDVCELWMLWNSGWWKVSLSHVSTLISLPDSITSKNVLQTSTKSQVCCTKLDLCKCRSINVYNAHCFFFCIFNNWKTAEGQLVMSFCAVAALWCRTPGCCCSGGTPLRLWRSRCPGYGYGDGEMEVSPSVFEGWWWWWWWWRRLGMSHQAFSGGLRWFPHFGWKHLHATSPWTLPGQELSSILWSFASFVVAPRDIVSDFCETLVQRTGSWGGWKLKGFNLCTLTFSFSAFCWIDC